MKRKESKATQRLIMWSIYQRMNKKLPPKEVQERNFKKRKLRQSQRKQL